MNVGSKAQGQRSHRKEIVRRHGHKRGTSRRSYAAQEKAEETRVRRAGKRSTEASPMEDKGRMRHRYPAGDREALAALPGFRMTDMGRGLSIWFAGRPGAPLRAVRRRVAQLLRKVAARKRG